jgi:integrase
MIAIRITEGKYSGNAERIARSRLETYAYPKLGLLQLQSIDADVLAETLRPIWLKKHETAIRVLALVTQVLRAALPDGYKLKGNLASAVADRLPRRPKGSHHAAMPYSEVPAFLARLVERGGMGALALQFVVHTAARSGEVRGATWAEIDMEGALWTVPASRMKVGKEHRVALSGAALAVLASVAPFRHSSKASSLVFPSSTGGPLSDMTLTKVMRDMKANAVPHGFRSTFRDWAAEQTSADRDVIEACLAHAIGGEVELAYKRTDFLEKRRKLMAAWAAFCAGSELSGKVVPFSKVGPASG